MSSWIERANIGKKDTRRLTCGHQVRIYENRLAISRFDGERLTWEEVQAVKQKVWGDRLCIEIYPSASDVVNLRHTRHLWWEPHLELIVKAMCWHPEFDRT